MSVKTLNLAEIMSIDHSLGILQEVIHNNAVSKGFWSTDDYGDVKALGLRLALIHSEVSEALEELRKPGPLGGEKAALFAEELADVVIRVLDVAEACGINLGDEVVKKHEKNTKRVPMHGKAF